ncbi:33858_t:CDS:1, partial [Racocetra persica]
IFIVALSSPIENSNNGLAKRQSITCATITAQAIGDLYYLNCTSASGETIYVSGPRTLACS